MARTPRRQLVDIGSANHCTWRAHDLEMVLESAEAKRFFLFLMATYKTAYGILIHSYCLMGTHPHVLMTSTLGQEAFSAFWKVVNHRFAVWYNRRYGRRGQVVMQRMRSPMIQPDGRHMLTVMRYGDLNPVRAGLVRSTKSWPWSSYRHYAFGEQNDLIDDAPDYLALGFSPAQRRLAYRSLFARAPIERLLRRRPEFVDCSFVGDDVWVALRTDALSAGPPTVA